MAFSKPKAQIAVSLTKLSITSVLSILICFCSSIGVSAQQAQKTNSDESWTATNQDSIENENPSRTVQSHISSGNRTVDTQRVEVLGLDGRFRANSETETETVRVDSTTTRTVVRTYKWDGNGRRTLAWETEEEAQSTANGDGHAVRTSLSSDVNGNLQMVSRELKDTTKTSPDTLETKTKIYLSNGNGGFAMAAQTQELQKRSDEHTIEVKKETLVPDGNGNWRVDELTEKTVRGADGNRTTEERVSRADIEGRLSETSRTVREETENTEGGKSNIVDKYSRNVPGSTDDGSMHWTERVTTLQKQVSDGETTEQQFEQPNPGNPSDSPQVTAKTRYTVRYAASGSEAEKTSQVPDNGGFKVFYVETRKSDQVSAPRPTTPSDKPDAANTSAVKQ